MPESPEMTLADYLVGPSTHDTFKVFIDSKQRAIGNQVGSQLLVKFPTTLRFYCDSGGCNKVMNFDWDGVESLSAAGTWINEPEIRLEDRNIRSYVAQYKCRHCKESIKGLFVVISPRESLILKVGQWPTQDEPLPQTLLDIASPSDARFLIQGYKAELAGFGVGAAAYYRRVVEDRTNAFISKAKEIASMQGEPAEVLKKFDVAMNNTQYTRAIDSIKNSIPKALFIGSTNPFLLLHKVLSIELHSLTDEECLANARHLRETLVGFCRKVDAFISDEISLGNSAKSLTQTVTPVAKIDS